ncbi:type II toxin-antitoxin system VapC family toxin [Pseudopedobacter beijingensis]|uniref:Type II toxin-antitoxin system VapC family toxin n=1 Tax=Pseudopedobacter beijingensis TaxID=1207056 RepID=A0ABW4I6X8_9SPHI
MILIDTSVLIDFLKRKTDAVTFIEREGKQNLAINTVIAMELYQGVLNKAELLMIKKELQGFFMLPINEKIANLALQLSQKYALSHHIGLSDTFIAATALIYDIELKTYNLKDFQFIPNINVSNFLV